MATTTTSSSGRLLRAVVIFAWIATLVALLAGGGYTAFIRPDFWPLMAGALAVLVLFLFAMLGKPGHSHATNPLSVVAAAMVVLLPVIYLPLARGQTLGTYAFDKRFVHDSGMKESSEQSGSASSGVTPIVTPANTLTNTLNSATHDSGSKPPANDPTSAAAIAMQNAGAMESQPMTQASASSTPKSGVWDDRALAAAKIEDVTISDLVMSPQNHLNKHVAVEGMFKNDSRLPKNYYAAYRFMIICCAADAQPSVLFLKADKPFDFVDGSWTRITGTLINDKLGGEDMPVLRVESVEPTPQPERPYMYYTTQTTSDTSTPPSTDLK